MSPLWSRPFRKGDNPDMIPAEFKLYRKKVSTLAARMDGPFDVETTEGTLRCENGWLAFDSRGYPYPIAADEFAQIYEEVPAENETRVSVDGPFHIIDGQFHPGVADPERCPVCTGVPFPAVGGVKP